MKPNTVYLYLPQPSERFYAPQNPYTEYAGKFKVSILMHEGRGRTVRYAHLQKICHGDDSGLLIRPNFVTTDPMLFQEGGAILRKMARSAGFLRQAHHLLSPSAIAQRLLGEGS